ncbi:Hypothetical protein, putative [Bodo saltans]|uniref:Uncharacterized protein n=1 Tax=Bodo saltans TaxID=75058 RepID=A0A0S4KHK5_BODSA|nr:Hypothetical protein, putative [Bodo saltans]|eukprot:CUI14076.1 Hypothetical protein, putative [Bodo saltans]
MSCDDVTVDVEASSTAANRRELILLQDLQELRRHLCEVSLECGVPMASLIQKFLVFKRDEVAVALASWPPSEYRTQEHHRHHHHHQRTSDDLPPTERDPFGDSSSSGSSSGSQIEEESSSSTSATSSSSHSNESFDTFMANMRSSATATLSERAGERVAQRGAQSATRTSTTTVTTVDVIRDDGPAQGEKEEGWFWEQCSVS